MALQNHFIVIVEGDKVIIDHEVSINYDEGRIYNTELDTWTDAYEYAREYERANELLQDLLMKGREAK